jgi:hypothetical protein
VGISPFDTGFLGGDSFTDPKVNPDFQNPARFAVRYWERWPQSPRSSWRDDGSQVTREYITHWEDNVYNGQPVRGYLDAVKDLLGYPVVSPLNNGGRYISRYIPDYFPLLSPDDDFAPNKPFLWCTDLREVEGLAIPTDQNCRDASLVGRYRYAGIQAVYETLTYDIYDDREMVTRGMFDLFGNPDESFIQTGRYVTKQPGPGVKYQTFPQGSFLIVAPTSPPHGTAYPGTPGRTEPECDFTVTWHQVPQAAVPLRLVNPYIANTVTGVDYIPAIEDCLGSVNLYSFADCRKGTLLLTSVGMKRIRSAIGMRLWDIEYRFKFFGVRSAEPAFPPGGGVPEYSYGHNLVLYIQASVPGYREIVSGGPVPVGGNAPAAQPSNYLRTPPLDYQNLFRYRPFASLFRVPQLKMDPGNA